ncbi:ABC transporter ATP-binding protein [Variovorax sp. WS11]|uniref:ABC transporter ATP-binding protein n=1 Tax=Variovorax sp. WS11 TaxID=1105204 RepID=UPI001EF3B279|nr:ABC transporter ATP-binding protein [Variovorax sp. WS11]
MMSNSDYLSIRGLGKTFTAASGQRHVAVGEVDLSIGEHEFVSIIGRSGCGKSTILRMVAGLEPCEQGRIELDGRQVNGPAAERGLVFQEYALFPWRTVSENIGFGLEIRGLPKAEIISTVSKFVMMIGLNGFENSLPWELSGGMRQRVAIATVLANNPKMLLMDEPFGALDAQTRLTMQFELSRIWMETRKSVLFITHSVEEAVYLSQRVVVMKAKPGAIQEIVDVDLPFPRDIASKGFNDMRTKLLNMLLDPVTGAH